MKVLGIGSRRLGTVLLAFGLVGVAVAGVVAVGLVGGAIAARDLDERIESDRARVAALLARMTVTIGSVVTTTDNAGVTLGTARDTLSGVGETLDRLAVASDELAFSLQIDILGSRPFAGTAQRFTEMAAGIRGSREDIDALAEALGTNARDVGVLSDQIDRIETDVDELADRVAEFDRADEIVGLLLGAVLLYGLLAAWIAGAAAMLAWVGWRLRRADGARG